MQIAFIFLLVPKNDKSANKKASYAFLNRKQEKPGDPYALSPPELTPPSGRRHPPSLPSSQPQIQNLLDLLPPPSPTNCSSSSPSLEQIKVLKSEVLLVRWNHRAQTRVTYGFRVNLMSHNSPSSMALLSRQLPIFGREQSIYTLHNMLQSIYLHPCILDINYN
jgi:hypothetical protein